MKGGDHIKTKNKEQPDESKMGCSSNRKKKRWDGANWWENTLVMR